MGYCQECDRGALGNDRALRVVRLRARQARNVRRAARMRTRQSYCTRNSACDKVLVSATEEFLSRQEWEDSCRKT